MTSARSAAIGRCSSSQAWSIIHRAHHTSAYRHVKARQSVHPVCRLPTRSSDPLTQTISTYLLSRCLPLEIIIAVSLIGDRCSVVFFLHTLRGLQFLRKSRSGRKMSFVSADRTCASETEDGSLFMGR